ncbi:hypothetical protein LTR66_000141 [Elasticomyces elasticus]|nr:hypothetical protein LTR50_005289 [Elasticomyces elasticus]KAK5001103.1 hypothetical protein LTR66_000141 [Elasticomyces elasticus]
MKNAIIALFSLLAVAGAVPMNKRDVVWVTEYAQVVETVLQTTTVWVDSTPATVGAAAVTSSFYGHRHTHGTTLTSVITSTLASASSSSVVVQPTAPSSSSVSVAPTTSTRSAVSVAPTVASSSSVSVDPTTPRSSSVVVAPTTSTTSVFVAPTTSTSSVVVAPTTRATSTAASVAPTTSVYVAPTTSASAVPTTTATPTTASASPASTVTAAGSKYTGDITHYDVGLGSCGWTSTADEFVVAIEHTIMNNPANPNNNPRCGKYVTLSYGGVTHQAKIVDTCGGCLPNAIDLSDSLFAAVAPKGDGRVHNVEWWFN